MEYMQSGYFPTMGVAAFVSSVIISNCENPWLL